ncbi:MAG: type II secretory pathway pseudopilin PulG [Chlamydiales bacterium]|jgi:type II secretory pathway pseudopilin PulG
MTLIELLIAVGLASILMLAVFRLLDTSLSLWSRGEVRRGALEQASATAELLAHDLRSLHRGLQGDLLAEWIPVDADGDGANERFWPRLLLVRQGSPAELARIAQVAALDAPAEDVGDVGDADEAGGLRAPRRPAAGLLEIAWVVLPALADPAEGVLWRAERAVDDPDSVSVFSQGYFDSLGRAPAGVLNEVTGGVLWMGMAFATQTSVVQDGWRIGLELADASGSWDAWSRGRPNPNTHAWNEAGTGMPVLDDVCLLPRRVRLELEIERPVDRARRTKTLTELDATVTSFQVENAARLPAERDAFLLIDAEWMRIVGVTGDRVKVVRAVRGSEPRPHGSGATVHHGVRVIAEVPIDLHQDEWNLR